MRVFMGREHLQNSDVNRSHEPVGIPLTRPSGTLSPSEGERDGVRGRSWGARPPRAPQPAPSPVGLVAFVFRKRRGSASAPGVVGEAPTTAPGAGALPTDSATG